jgi:hypothetical protein
MNADQRPHPSNSGAVDVNRTAGSQRPKVYGEHAYITRGGASAAGRGMRSGDEKTRKDAAKYMAQYRNKNKQSQK